MEGYINAKEGFDVQSALNRWGYDQVVLYLMSMLNHNKLQNPLANAVVFAEMDQALQDGRLQYNDILTFRREKAELQKTASPVEIKPVVDMYNKVTMDGNVLTFEQPKIDTMKPTTATSEGRIFSIKKTPGIQVLPLKGVWVEICSRMAHGTRVKNGLITKVQTQDMLSAALKPYCNTRRMEDLVGAIIGYTRYISNLAAKQYERKGKKVTLEGGLYDPGVSMSGNAHRAFLYRTFYKDNPAVFLPGIKSYEDHSGVALAEHYATVERELAPLTYVTLSGEKKSVDVSLPTVAYPVHTDVKYLTLQAASHMLVNVSTCLGGKSTSYGQDSLECQHGFAFEKDMLKLMADSIDLQSIEETILDDVVFYDTKTSDEAFSYYRHRKSTFEDADIVYVYMRGGVPGPDSVGKTLTGGVLTTPRTRKGRPAIYLHDVSYGAGANAAATYTADLNQATTAFLVHADSRVPVWYTRQTHAYAQVLTDRGYDFNITHSSHASRGLFLYRVINAKYLHSDIEANVFANLQDKDALMDDWAFVSTPGLKDKDKLAYAKEKRKINKIARWATTTGFPTQEAKVLLELYRTKSVPFDNEIQVRHLTLYAQYATVFGVLYPDTRSPWNETVEEFNALMAESESGEIDPKYEGFRLLKCTTDVSRCWPTKKEIEDMEELGLPAFVSRVRINLTDEEVQQAISTAQKPPVQPVTDTGEVVAVQPKGKKMRFQDEQSDEENA